MREARARRIAIHGADHPWVAALGSSLGSMLLRLGELDEATAVLDHARGVAHKSLGDKHPLLGSLEVNRAAVAARRKDWPAAETALRASLAVHLLVFGPAYHWSIQNRTLIARALREQGKLREARAELERARESAADAPPTMLEKIEVDVGFARLAIVEKRWRDAEAHARAAVAAYEAIDAKVSTRAAALLTLAEAVAPRDPRKALDLYDRGLTLATTQVSRDRHLDVEVLEDVAKVALAAKRPARALAWFDKLPDAAAHLGALRARLERAN